MNTVATATIEQINEARRNRGQVELTESGFARLAAENEGEDLLAADLGDYIAFNVEKSRRDEEFEAEWAEKNEY